MSDRSPTYVALARSGELARRAREAAARLGRCDLCSRTCAAESTTGRTGECGIGKRAVVAGHGPHQGEERVLSGRAGSGTVFFSGCNLHCAFCQNWDISHEVDGQPLDAEQLAEVFPDLQKMGCHNLNLVTPSHVLPHILAALDAAADNGLRLPLVYNTSGYDAVETLRLLDGVVDVYMPDLKTLDPSLAGKALTADDYAEVATAPIIEMHRQVGDLVVSDDDLATRGLLVRHLAMPGMTADSVAVLDWLADLSRDTFVNIMGQYRPCGDAACGGLGDDFRRRPTSAGLAAAVDAARRAGLRPCARSAPAV
jgi:putative pyruvate formate lyase activating enzyme